MPPARFRHGARESKDRSTCGASHESGPNAAGLPTFPAFPFLLYPAFSSLPRKRWPEILRPRPTSMSFALFARDPAFPGRPIRLTILFAMVLGLASVLPAAPAPLRLVATVSGQDFDQFEVQKGFILAKGAEGPRLLEGRAVRWRLEGDLLAQADRFNLSPSYVVEAREPVAGQPDKDQRFDARVTLPNYGALMRSTQFTPWNSTDLAGGIAVFVWLLDGKTVFVAPVGLPDSPSDLGMAPAVQLLALSDETRRGTAAIMLWKEGRFVASAPLFGKPELQSALAAMILGTGADFDGALAQVRDVNDAAKNQATLLHLAAEAGRTDALEKILARGAKLNVSTGPGRTPLAWSAQKGQDRAFEILVASGAAQKLGTTELEDLAITAGNAGHLALALKIVEAHAGWKWKSAMEALAANAARLGRADVLRLLVSHGAGKHLASVPVSILAARAREGDRDSVEILLANKLDPRKQDDYGTTALHAAAQHGFTSLVADLLKARARVDATDTQGRTALMLAARNGHIETVTALLNAKPDPNRRDENGMTALHYSVLSGNPEVIRALLVRNPVTGLRDKSNLNPLERALAARVGPAVDVLLQAGLKLDLKNSPAADQVIEGILALDRADLLATALQQGWNPAKPLLGKWRVSQIAMHFAATACQKLLAAGDGSSATMPETPDIPARSLYRPTPAALFGGPRGLSGHATVMAFVDERGAVQFPRISGDPGGEFALAVAATLRTWKFQPATRGGRPIMFPFRVEIDIQPAPERVYDAHEVDLWAAVRQGESIPPPTMLRRMVLVGYNDREEPVLDANGRQIGSRFVRTPVYETVSVDVPQLGEIILSVIVEPDGLAGAVSSLRQEGGTTLLTWPDILAMVANYRFAPAIRDGQPVRSRLVLRLGNPVNTYTLEDLRRTFISSLPDTSTLGITTPAGTSTPR